ncbi:MAG TPA: NAD(P)-dependent oxidoreductase [Terriglobales bacterium]|nr:NAD(P)-dependent oxidoreductase [Terriglobales bacterium]
MSYRLQQPVGKPDFIVAAEDPILITGATGFIGLRVVEQLLSLGFRNLRCLARPWSNATKLDVFSNSKGDRGRIQVIRGNLLSREDCATAAKDVKVIYHLAAARGEKSVPDAFMNSVVTTRNLMEACILAGCLRRFVNVSSFAVYSNAQRTRGRILDESCPTEKNPHTLADAYCFAKVKQDEIVEKYGEKYGVPYVIVRPGYVYGPGNLGISGRVGIGSFGIFLHLGGSNPIPFSYVDNCANAIVLAGLRKGVERQIFNIIDDDLPSSRKFLRLYKKNVRWFPSLYVPPALSYGLCYLWERYSVWSHGQLAPVFNRKKWHNYWKKMRYSNQKLKDRLGWTPSVPTSEGLRRYFEACRTEE